MKWLIAFSLAILIGFASPRDARTSSAVQLRIPEEREIITREKLDEYLASKDDNTGDIIDLAKSAFGGIVTISQIDFSQSGGKIAWEIAEAVVPVIGAALALIPGVGVIVSGVFLGIWSVLSPMFAPKKDNPMEKMINELAAKMDKKMDDKLKNLVSKAVYGEISRNNYICNKYSYISSYFAKEFKSNTSLSEIDAVKLMVYLNDCDNFLKDTAEAFVYDEYADILWVPGAMTTSSRVGFLAELIKVGHLLGMTRNVTVMYFQELKHDTKRQFEFHTQGLKRVNEQLTGNKRDYKKTNDYFKDVSAVETAACRLQGQFFYFDRELYSYGMPTILNNTDAFADIKMADHFKPDDKHKVEHLQAFFNVTSSKFPGNLPARGSNERPHRSLEFMNCHLGPMHLIAPSTAWFNFHPMPENRYSYEFRVIYTQRDFGDGDYEQSIPLLTELKKGSDKFKQYEQVHKKVNKDEDISGRTCLNIEFVYPYDHKTVNETAKKLVDVPGWSRWKTCPYRDYQTDRDYPFCNTFINVWEANFRMYSAGTFNHRDEVLNSLIAIDEPSRRFVHYSGSRYNPQPNGFIIGVEVILRPRID